MGISFVCLFTKKNINHNIILEMVMISPSNIAYSVNSFENIIFVAKEEKSMNFKFETRLVSVEFTVYISSTFDS